MTAGRDSGSRGDTPAGLQPGGQLESDPTTADVVSVAASELAALESDEAAVDQTSRQVAERLTRLAVDRDLYDRLAAAGFRGSEYRQFANELAAYGIAVVTAWLLSGEIFQLCAARQRGVGSRPATWTDHDISGLVNDCVTAALVEFQARAQVGRGWEYSEKGASLKTYFITGCVYAFPNVYRQWRWNEERWWRLHDLREALDDITSDSVGAPDVAITAINRVEVAAAYSCLSEKEQLIALYELAGYSNAEIAELLQMRSSRSVEGVLYRLQKNSNKQRTGEDGHE